MTTTQTDVTATLFQDAMDPTRFLRIKTEKTNSVVCKVFFTGKGGGHTYHGLTELPKRLFYFEGSTRIGFNAYNPMREAELLKLREQHAQRKAQYREDRDER